jgi:hypothetical protein
MACKRVGELAPGAKDLALHGAQAVGAVRGDFLVAVREGLQADEPRLACG